MKKRKTFVSNSSSTSFIIENEDDKKQFKLFTDIKYFKVKELLEDTKELLENISKSVKKFNEKYCLDDGSYIYDFLVPYDTYDMDVEIDTANCYIGKYEELLKKYGNEVQITSPVDRDDAYENGVNLSCFQTDL